MYQLNGVSPVGWLIIRGGPAQDVTYNLILWYLSIFIYLL